MQIGAYDGKTGDPLYPFLAKPGRWSGVLVEPSKQAFRHLQQTYRINVKIVPERCAIANFDGEVELFCEPRFNASRWRCQTSSLIETAYRKASRSSATLAHSEIVPAMTLDTLLRRHALDYVDVFCSDAEGYDGEIIRQLLKLKLRPSIVSYESWMLSDLEQATLVSALKDEGYQVTTCPPDTHAVLRN